MRNLKLLYKILLLILFAIAIIITVVLYAFLPKPIRNINKYSACINLIENKAQIKHFPIKINIKKKDATLYCQHSDTGNYEIVLLALKVDKSYIEHELKSHSFLNINTPVGTQQKIYYMPTENVGLSGNNLTYYVLDDKNNFNENELYFPYFTGIGISKDMNYILYYYINPE